MTETGVREELMLTSSETATFEGDVVASIVNHHDKFLIVVDTER